MSWVTELSQSDAAPRDEAACCFVLQKGEVQTGSVALVALFILIDKRTEFTSPLSS